MKSTVTQAALLGTSALALSSTVMASTATNKDLPVDQSSKITEVHASVCGGQVKIEASDDDKTTVVTSYQFDKPYETATIGASVSNGVLKIAFSKECKDNCKKWSSTTVKIPKNELVNLQAYAATNLFVDGKLISNGQVKFASDSVSNVVISDLSGEYQQLDLSTKSAGGIYIQGSPTISKSSIQAQSASLVQAEVNSMKNLKVQTNGAGTIALQAKSGAKFDSFIGTTEGASQAQLCSLQFANISANVAGAGSIDIGATTGASINGKVGGVGSLRVYASSSPDLSGVSTRGAATAKFAYQATCKRKVIKAPMVLTIEELKERANDPKCQDIIIPDSGSSSDSGSNGASSTAVSGIVVMTMAMAVIGML